MSDLFTTRSLLRQRGVLGMNARNIDYIGRYNDRARYPLVDNKLKTKLIAQKASVSVPDLLHVITTQHEIETIDGELANREQFVIKPAQGSGGDGIIVVTGRSERKRDSFRLASGVLVTEGEMLYHLSNIVGGQYSLSGNPDTALIEYCVKFDPVFADVSYQGVPDIRVVVYRGYPAMAMVRLPTRASDGKANLHQGAVGAGIDMGSGKTLHGVLEDEVVEEHPDTGALVAGLEIPHWDFILESSARAYEVTGLGYLGVDMVIDRDLGPLVLEMNARPGLNIQIANGTGLSKRIARIEALHDADAAPAVRAATSRREFAL